MYRLLTPVNLEYSPASNYHAVNYKYVNDKIAEVQETITTDLSGLDELYAAIDHTHTGFALADHNHDISYSAISHNHDSAYASVNHDHSGTYSPIDHNHNSEYAGLSHNHDTAYSAIGHTHDYSAVYSAINHTHNQFLVNAIDTVSGSSIILDRNKAMYKKSIAANTTLIFDDSNLTIESNEVMTFELVIVMGATVYTVTFPNNVTWLEGNAPVMTTLNKSYICTFRSYDGGTNWIGCYQGSF